MSIVIYPGSVQGRLRLPPSKSHTMRALLFASLAKGTSVLRGVLASPDTEAMMQACMALGAQIRVIAEGLEVKGIGGRGHVRTAIDCGNSGQVLRFFSAVGACGASAFTVTGDASVQRSRPITALVDALQQGGVAVETLAGRPPLRIQGPLQPGEFRLEGQDSQPVSAMLIACSLLDGPSRLIVRHLGERPWVGLTCWWLNRLGAPVRWTRHEEYDCLDVPGGWVPSAWEGSIPSDWSSAAFPLAAAVLVGRELILHGLDPDDPQGDREIVPVLQSLGAQIRWQGRDLVARQSLLQGGVLDANAIIDAVPILCALGPSTQTGIHLTNVAIARRKESDRLEAMAEGIRRLGGRVEMGEDWIHVHPVKLGSGQIDSHQDHRIAMAFTVAALHASGPVRIVGVDCVGKSYPGFFADLASIGLHLREDACASSC